ncbi:leucine-rich repeat domain-containing protein [Metamycoplasma neophronis]|uniref:Leucine-rich repeat domain-containing protein n=2 Tax=Metamycoplasma neophronis TaxID=872983 RepID=A0ABY2YZP8_9BACT|nr:leucine-rich repeat domain-containing protein [Metamycoplasma neophronis]
MLTKVGEDAFSKIIENGVLIKWTNASGDISDSEITAISDGVFKGNTNITSVSFPNVTKISPRAFQGAVNLTHVDLPKLEEIDYKSFDNTPGLGDKIVLNGILAKWDNAEGDISDDEITVIAADIFYNNQNITSVSFPNVIKIGSWAFRNAINLTSVDLPKVKEIDYKSFDNTPGLGDKIVLNGILAKWDNAEGHIIDDKVTTIADGVFQGNRNITSVSLPNVTKINARAFRWAVNLTHVDLPKLEEIDYNAFDNTPGLGDKIVLNGILAKWDNAEGDISDDEITVIGANIFYNNHNITSVSFPNVIKIGSWAFRNAINLTSVDLPKVKEIGIDAFTNTPKLINKPSAQ